MTLLDHVTIPSSLDLCRWSRESTDSRNERRLRGSGLTPTVCPICNHRATVEELTVTRPGEGTVHRRVLRCQRKPHDWGTVQPRCPVQVLAEVPAEDAAPLDLTPAPAPATARRCLDCGCGGLVGNRKRCEPCASEAKRRSTREAKRALRGCIPRTTCLDCGCDIQPGYGRLRCRPCAEESARRQRHESKRRHEARLRSLPPESPQKPSEAADPPETPPTPPEAVTEHSGRQDDATPGPTPAEEETSMDTQTRTCADCGCDISHRFGTARYCEECAKTRRKDSTREALRRLYVRKKAAYARAKSTQVSTPPRALTLSVLDLAAQIRSLPPDVRAIVDDVASLSPERQALLRTVLADAEEVA